MKHTLFPVFLIGVLSFSLGFVTAGAVGQMDIGPRPDLLPRDERPGEGARGVLLQAVNEDLEKVLQTVSEQSGVRLALSSDVQRENLRVTVYTRGVSLPSFMAAIALTYGLTWVKKGATEYALVLYPIEEVSPAMRWLMRLGRIENIEKAYWAGDAVQLAQLVESQLSPQQKGQLASGGAPPEAEPGGVLVESLPPEVRKAAKEVYKKRRAAVVIKALRDTTPDQILSLRLLLPRR